MKTFSASLLNSIFSQEQITKIVDFSLNFARHFSIAHVVCWIIASTSMNICDFVMLHRRVLCRIRRSIQQFLNIFSSNLISIAKYPIHNLFMLACQLLELNENGDLIDWCRLHSFISVASNVEDFTVQNSNNQRPHAEKSNIIDEFFNNFSFLGQN